MERCQSCRLELASRCDFDRKMRFVSNVRHYTSASSSPSFSQRIRFPFVPKTSKNRALDEGDLLDDLKLDCKMKSFWNQKKNCWKMSNQINAFKNTQRKRLGTPKSRDRICCRGSVVIQLLFMQKDILEWNTHRYTFINSLSIAWKNPTE